MLSSTARSSWFVIATCVALAGTGGCGSSAEMSDGAAATGGVAGVDGSAAGAASGGVGGMGGAAAAAGTAGTMQTAGAGGMGDAGGAATTGGTAGTMVQPETGGSGPAPATCAEAARAYTISVSMLDASFVPEEVDRFWGGAAPRTPVAVDPETGSTYVAFTRAEGDGRSVVIAAEDSAPEDVITIADAAIGGVATTSDGVGALLFDPNADVDARVWAAVARFTADGTQVFKTDLFHSPNLDDEGTKGAPSSGRLGYVPGTDELVAYFGHTQRYDDGVRHQGGYLATLSATGTQDVISGWFGSHNLEQRLMIDGDRIALLGLGDAFPKGIFFSYADNARTNVIYRLAADGVGTTNGQLGGMVDFEDRIVAPFITNRSVAQDLDAGEWPDIDDAISMQIRDAAAAGTDLGLLSVPKDALPGGDLAPVWLAPEITAGARLGSLKSVKYGTGELVLVAWAEITGSERSSTSAYYTMIVDSDGAVCQPKAELEAVQAFTPGDDLVRRPDGSIVWGNVQGARVQIVTLTP